MNYLPNAQPYPSLPGATLAAEGLLDTLPWGVLVLDEQHIIRRVNQQAARWCGASPDALQGQPLAGATLPPALRTALLQLLEPAEPALHEVWLPELAEWIALSAARQPGGWVLYAQDITPQKQREQQYQTLADNTPDVLTRWTPDLRLHYANGAFAAKAGQPLSALLGRTFSEMDVPTEVTGPYMAALRRVFDTGQPQEHYNPFPTPHGTTYYYSRLVPELRDGRVATVLGIARDITELRHTQAEALRLRDGLMQHATDQYQTLFHTMDQGFCVLQVVFDEASQHGIDFRYIELNPAFARQSGLPADALGKSMRELIPDLEPFWFETYGRVTQTGNTERFEHYVPQLGRWLDVHAFRVGTAEGGQVAVLFNDITERKQQEATLRASEARQVFRLQLSDAMRQLTNPVAIQATVAQMLGQHLGADWVSFLEIDDAAEALVVVRDWHRPGTATPPRRYPLASWHLPWLLSGQPWVSHDTTHDPQVPDERRLSHRAQHVRALVAVPLLRQGQLVTLLVATQATPRTWTLPEVSLLKETMERTWAAVGLARTEEARHASEQRLRAVMENLPGGAVFVVDANLRYQVAEGAAMREAGLRAADFVGRPVQELVPPALWPDYQRLYGQALAGQPFEYEHEQRGRAFITRGGPLRAADGSVAAVLAVSYDITARKRAEAALQESSEKYRTLFNSIDEGYCIIEVLFDDEGQPHDWRFIEVNPAFEKNNGLSNATGKTIRELTPNIEPKWFATYGRVAQTGQPLRFEEDSVALGRWFTLYAFTVGAPGSNLVAVLFTDITARKQAEDALRLSESRLSLALQAGRMGSFEWTAEGNRISLSAMSHEVLGMLPGTSFATSEEGFVLLHPDDRARHQALFEEAGRTGQDFHSIFRIVRPRDGQVRWIEERGQGVHDAGGVCLRGVHWDVTETMLAQQRLAEFNTKLEQRVARRTRDLQASRDLLQSVFDTSLLAMSVMEAVRDDAGVVQDFRLHLVSREVMRETGRTDLVGKLYSAEYPGVREVGILALAIKALETGEPQGMEYFYPYEGFDKWFACQFVKLGDGVVATNLDITERKTAEQELLKNLRLLEQAEAVAGLGSWDYELATRTMRWSSGMYQLFGLPAGSAVAPASYLSVVVAEDRARAKQLVRRLAAGTGDFEETLRLRVGDQIKTVRMKAVVFHDAQNQAVRVLGVDLDISELQRLEQDNLQLRLRQQHALFEAVQAAQEAERKRMAESLHNGIGQILYATKLRLDRLHAPLLGTDPALAAARREADQLLGEAIRQSRALSHELVPMVLEEFGLAAALRDTCRKMSSPQLRLRCVVQLDKEVAPLAPTLQMALFRMAQELAQNIVKHARGATEASIELETMPGWVLLRAEDDGPGLVPANKPGLGLRSIRDRVALLGGQVEIGSATIGGAYVRIRIPLSISPLS